LARGSGEISVDGWPNLAGERNAEPLVSPSGWLLLRQSETEGIERPPSDPSPSPLLPILLQKAFMTEQEILAQLNKIFCNIFDNDSIVLTPATTAKDIEGWDSIQNITITVVVEARFGVKFLTSEIELLQNVGDFITLIKAKLNARGA
jgi:acyl carrier protein